MILHRCFYYDIEKINHPNAGIQIFHTQPHSCAHNRYHSSILVLCPERPQWNLSNSWQPLSIYPDWHERWNLFINPALSDKTKQNKTKLCSQKFTFKDLLSFSFSSNKHFSFSIYKNFYLLLGNIMPTNKMVDVSAGVFLREKKMML